MEFWGENQSHKLDTVLGSLNDSKVKMEDFRVQRRSEKRCFQALELLIFF